MVGLGLNASRGVRYSDLQNMQTSPGAYPASYSLGWGAFSLLRLKNERSCTFIPPVYLHDMVRETFSSGRFW